MVVVGDKEETGGMCSCVDGGWANRAPARGRYDTSFAVFVNSDLATVGRSGKMEL